MIMPWRLLMYNAPRLSDRRGFGRPTTLWGGYDYNTLADDLAAVIAQLGLPDVTLVGFSMEYK
jgi:pimeloyl-ACP methyl ester carboxylesterase